MIQHIHTCSVKVPSLFLLDYDNDNCERGDPGLVVSVVLLPIPFEYSVCTGTESSFDIFFKHEFIK